MPRLGHYLRVYREFLATCFAEATSYRAHFVLLILMELVFYATSLASVDMLYLHVERVGVWNRPQFLFRSTSGSRSSSATCGPPASCCCR
jgi:ABC-2 type transport system permease protein